MNPHNKYGEKPPHEHSLPRDGSWSFHYATQVPFLAGGGGQAPGSMRSVGEVSMTDVGSHLLQQQQHQQPHQPHHQQQPQQQQHAENMSGHLSDLESRAQPFDANSSYGFQQMQVSANSSMLFGTKGLLPPPQVSTGSGFLFPPQQQPPQQHPLQPAEQASYPQYQFSQSQQQQQSAYPFQPQPPPQPQPAGNGSAAAYPFAQPSFPYSQSQSSFQAASYFAPPPAPPSHHHHHPHSHHHLQAGFGTNHSLASFNFPPGMSQLHLSQSTLLFPQANMSFEQHQPSGLDALFSTISSAAAATAAAPLASSASSSAQPPPLNLFGARNTKPASATSSMPKRNRTVSRTVATTTTMSPPPSDDGGEGDVNMEEKKGQWTVEEDLELKLLVEDAAAKGQNILDIPFDDIRLRIPGRTLKQVRERWRSNLDPSIIKGEWTLDEDLTILRMRDEQSLGWAVIARALRGRTEHSVKTRHRSMQRAQRRPWSDKEDKAILSQTPNHPSADVFDHVFVQISQQLKNRDAVSVKLRWMELIK